MPVWLETAVHGGVVFVAKDDGHWWRSRSSNRISDCINIGFVNNMPDSALKSTERQLIALIGAAAGTVPVRIWLYTLPTIPRADWALQYMSMFYSELHNLWSDDLDALVVTGTEPRAANLAEEPYWNSLQQIVDWAEGNTISTIWSCLAAHGAVLHLDGIDRHRLAQKCVGVFAQQRVADHPLLQNVQFPLRTPHSRWNEISQRLLAASGYSVLTRSTIAGVDIFLKQQKGSLFIFFQGHPEYDADTLLREYRRDVGRYLRREIDLYPTIPVRYFNSQAEASLIAFQRRALSDRRSDLLASFPDDLVAANLKNIWHTEAMAIYRNWLLYLSAQKRRRRANRAATRGTPPSH
jgi:homoserine O-succinyltransferase